jgi:hypothetical protein
MGEFFRKYLHTCRFRILTHASSEWLRQALKLLPTVQRYIAWNYIQVIPCENFTKYAKLYDLLSREQPFVRYFCCGDSVYDVEAVPEVAHKLGLRALTRSLRFVPHPSVDTLQFEWDRLDSIFQQFMFERSHVPHLSRHFVFTDDGKSDGKNDSPNAGHNDETYARPGWYGTYANAALRADLDRGLSTLPSIPEVSSGSEAGPPLPSVIDGVNTKS